MILSLLVSSVMAGAPAAAWSPPSVPTCSNVGLLVKYDYAYVAVHKCELCGSVSPEAKANVALLKDMVEKGTGCVK